MKERILSETNGDGYTTDYKFTKEQQDEISQAVKDYFIMVNKSTPRTIIGVDERQTVATADNRIAILLMKFPGQAVTQGSGFLIDRSQFFATAAHCLYNIHSGQRPEWITVIPGSTNGSAPIGTYTAVFTAVNPEYINNRNNDLIAKNYDYGVIKLDRNTPDMDALELIPLSDRGLDYLIDLFGIKIQGYAD